jgi:hypothetical protein
MDADFGALLLVAYRLSTTAYPRLDLADVLQLLVDGLDQRAFAQQLLVPQAHHAILHVPADFCEECEAWTEEHGMQGLRERAPVPEELSPKACGAARHGLAVVNSAWRQPQGQQCTLVVDAEMQFAAVAPPSRSCLGQRGPRRPWAWPCGAGHTPRGASSR